MKYIYNIAENKVVCVSRFAGKAVRGIAKCDASCDTFDVESGKELSQARCDVKGAEKRVKRANQKVAEAFKAYEQAKKYLDKMHEYSNDANAELNSAVLRLQDVESKFE